MIMMEIYSKTIKKSNNMKLVQYFNLENDAKA